MMRRWLTHDSYEAPTVTATGGTQPPLWGAPRIAGELRKIGIDLTKSTVERYMIRVLAHERRRVLHFNVTANPTAECPDPGFPSCHSFPGKGGGSSAPARLSTTYWTLTRPVWIMKSNWVTPSAFENSKLST